MTGKDRPLILLFEDDDNDVLLMQRALKKAAIESPVIVVRDGQEGIDYMEGSGKYHNRSYYSLPDIIILDLKMPRKTGLEFLEWMQAHPKLRVIPTILLSSSKEDSDISKAYDLGVNTYFVKPCCFAESVELVKAMQQYWIRAIKPKAKPSPKSASGSS
jgi:CheY-like chemotaxis protein